jgi:hypothetical protein
VGLGVISIIFIVMMAAVRGLGAPSAHTKI